MTSPEPTPTLFPQTAMARETAEAADAVARLLAHADRLDPLVARLAATRVPLCAICARGSSGHAGVHLRYLVETRLGFPVTPTAPSVVTTLERSLALENALFVVISQSGRSPDLVKATRAAREAGAITVAIVNDTASPAAQAAEWVLPMEAGPEKAVAATKSVVASMALGALLVARLSKDTVLEAALARLPDRLRAVHTLDWSAMGTALTDARAAFVAGRGFGFGPAREIALKAAETLCLPALAYSAAELLHGPRAAVGPQTPLLALRVGDATARSVDTLVDTLRADGLAPFLAGGPDSALPWIGDDHPVTDAIAMLVPAYRMIEHAARKLGYDPDNPPRLSKVTETL